MNAPIPNKVKVNAIVKPIIPLELPTAKTGKKDEVKSIDHQRHNTPRDNNTGKYTIKIPMSDSVNPEEWIIFDDLVRKCV